jgi:23S rRNA U2552 (ribose-2'-O)-methylase RlmE/FtsJ
MESLVLQERSWESIRLYNRTPLLPSPAIESNEIEYAHCVEEAALHTCRNKINVYEESLMNGKNWEYYKKIVNPYEVVYTQKKYPNFPESICVLKPLSRSYFKMIEMTDLIHFFNMFPNEMIRTAHVCEGPGGFIEALFDESAKNNRKIHMSIAMTLKSKRTNVPGWKRAEYFLKKNKNIRIIFGEDDTGDIMKPENQQYFIDYATNPEYGGKIHIFTADGGFDFSCDYTKQEEMVFPLLLASTKIGLEVLKPGGVFILKLFDFYHPATVDLLYFLSHLFEVWTLYKPGMSRPCNPEHYFIGKGFIGCSDKAYDILRLWCSMVENHQPLTRLFLTEQTNTEFHDIIAQLRKKSFNIQTTYLERVFQIIEKNDEEQIRNYLTKNERTSYDWCVRFNVPICAHRSRLTEELHNDQLTFCQ